MMKIKDLIKELQEMVFETKDPNKNVVVYDIKDEFYSDISAVVDQDDQVLLAIRSV